MNVSKTRLAIGTSLMALTFGMLGGGTAYAFQEHMFNAEMISAGRQESKGRKWTSRKRGRVAATSNQPGQSRHSSWCGHALAAEIAVAHGHAVRE